jgi:hypothetical protein
MPGACMKTCATLPPGFIVSGPIPVVSAPAKILHFAHLFTRLMPLPGRLLPDRNWILAGFFPALKTKDERRMNER